ncbi:hypothetical protein P691DRAFT_680885 [Macrolepiota fuliginosa MF-IS2]|uniref:F-box domain-containing protein n=1 Tax=Macrolepiota fuliginosa MF-IS2 TaxID=1400762 RepID=A0A9P5X1F4_9AGAR|nr:hypothetical protein P691DRAFT_680885 [Macrolepiota fuliginosa MF-IS2]
MNPAAYAPSLAISRENAATAVLTNPDILELILEDLAVGYVWEVVPEAVVESRRVLAAAALTCRAWMEPALDRLWRSLDKLFPLFRLLPAFYRSDTTFVLRGRVSEEDWGRFDWYAGRVKSFCYTRDPDSLDIAMHVYFRIAQLRRQPLLPALRHLRCPHISQDDFLISSICLFLTPSLKVLDFEKITGVEDKLIGTFLHTLLCEEARIERVMLVGEGLTKDTLGYLGLCRSLRSLVVTGMGRYVDLEIVRSLGRIPQLEELELDLEESGLLNATESDVVANSSHGGAEGELGYRELTSLEFIAPLSFVKTFVMQIGATQLRHIGFESSLEGTVDRRDLLVGIVRRWKDSLTFIRMVHHSDGGSEDESTPPGITMDTISPLLRLSKLTHFELEGYSLELRDANVTQMAQAWPQIHTLHLPYMDSGTQRPTVASLQTLSLSCMELRHLTIPLDTNDFLAVAEAPISLHRLHMLTAATPDEPWELWRSMRLARAVDHLFPFLAKVVSSSGEREGGRWSQAHHLVKMCQSVRTEAMELYRRNT